MTADSLLYFKQWLQTATGGKVVAHFALVVNRMTLKCNVCEMMLCAKQPETATEIDYGVQEFVKIHAHTGGHCSHVWVAVADSGSSRCEKCKEWLYGDVPPTPVTCDFKKVKPEGIVETTRFPLDENYADRLTIQKQMEALLTKQQELQAEIIEQQKASENVLERLLLVPAAAKSRPKPLKIATGRKFR